MPYCTFDDVMGRYPPLQTMVGSGEYQVTTGEVSSLYVPDAAAIIDSMIGFRYVVPVTPTPQLLTMVNADIAIYKLLAEKLPSVPDFAQKRYDYSMDLLKMLVEGGMTLGPSATLVPSGDNFAWSPGIDDGVEYHPVFSPVLGDLDQQEDRDLVNAEKDVRRGDARVSSAC